MQSLEWGGRGDDPSFGTVFLADDALLTQCISGGWNKAACRRHSSWQRWGGVALTALDSVGLNWTQRLWKEEQELL